VKFKHDSMTNRLEPTRFVQKGEPFMESRGPNFKHLYFYLLTSYGTNPMLHIPFYRIH